MPGVSKRIRLNFKTKEKSEEVEQWMLGYKACTPGKGIGGVVSGDRLIIEMGGVVYGKLLPVVLSDNMLPGVPTGELLTVEMSGLMILLHKMHNTYLST